MISADITKRVIEALERCPDRLSLMFVRGSKYNGIENVLVRRCSRSWEYSGGLVIIVQSVPYEHMAHMSIGERRQLRKGWTYKQLGNAIDSAVGEIMSQHHLNMRRDELCRKFNGVMNDAMRDAVEAEAIMSGRTEDYSEMTGDDVDFWNQWLEGQS